MYLQAAQEITQSLYSRGSWNGGITVAEAVAVEGEPTEGGDVLVMGIMMTWNVGDPNGRDDLGYDDDGE
jgi:hypothetical protein